MAKKGNAKILHHRCRVDASILVTAEERTIRLGPGLLISDEEYRQLIERKDAWPEWFEDVREEEAATEEKEKEA